MESANTTLNFGNNETWAIGVFQQEDKTFLAMTFTQSKEFKTEARAIKWFTSQGLA